MPKILLVYPENPVTFWSFDEALKLVGKRSAFPPLGLLTVAAMLPRQWEMRLVDMNVGPLLDQDIEWADCVLTSSMLIHWPSLEKVIARCNAVDTPVLCGGPLPTQYHREIRGDAVFYLGEGENGFAEVVEDLAARGRTVERAHIDRRGQFLPLEVTPLPRWDLVDFDPYVSMVVQLTRGCPEHCTFCNIPFLYGNRTRLKPGHRAVAEIDLLHRLGWRDSIMVVDDNFIGNGEAIRALLEEEIIPWQQERGHPYHFHTQVSIRLSAQPELMDAMRRAGFYKIFCGIESPVEESLKFMGASKNLEGSLGLVDKVRVLQHNGFEVQAGFIMGFDTDPDDIAERMIDFIQEAAIPVAMVGLLGVVPDTADYRRFKRAGRLVEDTRYTGDTGIFSRNLSFVPLIDPEELFSRHRQVVETIYSPRYYFRRCRRALERAAAGLKPPQGRGVRLWELRALLRSLWSQGVRSPYRGQYWRFMAATLGHPRQFAAAAALAISGHHFITATERALQVDEVRSFLESVLDRFEVYCRDRYGAFQTNWGQLAVRWEQLGVRSEVRYAQVERRLLEVRGDLSAMQESVAALLELAEEICDQYSEDFGAQLQEPLTRFREGVERLLNTYAATLAPA